VVRPGGADNPVVLAKIVLINPRFEVSYWGMEYALPILCKRANLGSQSARPPGSRKGRSACPVCHASRSP
jgi:hypothetical protein